MIKNFFSKRAAFISLMAGLLLLQSPSCKKFLQVQPRGYMFEEEAFSTPKGVESVLNGIYQSLSDSLLYGNVITMDATEGMAQYYYSSSVRYLGMDFEYTIYKLLFDGIWKKAYSSILQVNNFSTHLQHPSFHVIETDERNILLGEAYAIRALLHFDQLRLFGPVYAIAPDALAIPYVRKASTEIQPILSARNAIAEILHDLDSALVLLDKDPVRVKGADKTGLSGVGETINYLSNRHRRMNYFAVKTLQARVLLYAGKNTEAWDAVNSVILVQEAFFPWQTETQLAKDPVMSGESFFGIENRKIYDYYRQLFSPMLTDDQINTPAPLRLNAIYDPASTDLRLKYWFKVGLEGDKAYKVFIKYSDVSIMDGAVKYYQPLIKKAELYLIAAETAPDLQQGYFYLNTLRLSRGLTPINFDAGSTRNDLLVAITDEYQREFIGEGQTFFMFKRLNLATIPEVTGSGTVGMNESKYVVPFPEDERYYR